MDRKANWDISGADRLDLSALHQRPLKSTHGRVLQEAVQPKGLRLPSCALRAVEPRAAILGRLQHSNDFHCCSRVIPNHRPLVPGSKLNKKVTDKVSTRPHRPSSAVDEAPAVP